MRIKQIIKGAAMGLLAGLVTLAPFGGYSLMTTYAYDNLTEGNASELTDYITQSPTNLTQGSVTLYASLPSTYLACLDSQGYSWDDGKTWSSKNTYTVNENGSYRLTLRDWNGNWLQSNYIVVSNIDNEAPKISIKKNGSTFKITITDDLSGIRDLSWSGSGSGTINYSGTTLSVTETISVISGGSYMFTATDNVGNVAYSNGEKSWFSVEDKSDDSACLYATIPQDVWEYLADKPFKWEEDSAYTVQNYHYVKKNGSYNIKVMMLDGSVYSTTLEVKCIKKDKDDSTSKSSSSSRSYNPSNSARVNNINNTTYSPVMSLIDAHGKATVTVYDNYYEITGIYWESSEMGRQLIATPNSRNYSATVDVPKTGSYTFTAYNSGGYSAIKTMSFSAMPSTSSSSSDAEKKDEGEDKEKKEEEERKDKETTSVKPKGVPMSPITRLDTGNDEAKSKNNSSSDELRMEDLAAENIQKDVSDYGGKVNTVDEDDYKVDARPLFTTGILMGIIVMLLGGVGIVAYITYRNRKNEEERKKADDSVFEPAMAEEDYTQEQNNPFV